MAEISPAVPVATPGGAEREKGADYFALTDPQQMLAEAKQGGSGDRDASRSPSWLPGAVDAPQLPPSLPLFHAGSSTVASPLSEQGKEGGKPVPTPPTASVAPRSVSLTSGGAPLRLHIPAPPQGALAGRGRSVPIPTSAPSSPSSPSQIQAIDVADLVTLLGKLGDTANLLIVDIRPSTVFERGHIRGSVNLCAPTTLLKRAEFSLERLETQMLSTSERARFGVWRTHADEECHIVVLDTDTRSSTTVGRANSGGGGPCLVGLLAKFAREGYPGRLRWVRGGFTALRAHPGGASYMAQGAPVLMDEDTSKKSARPPSLTLNTFHLHSVSTPHSTPSPSRTTNPFFSSLRREMEMARGHVDVVATAFPELTPAQLARLPRFLQELVRMPSDVRARHVAHQFMQLEKREMDRLHAVIERHTHESSPRSIEARTPLLSLDAAYPRTPTVREMETGAFPLSITAALDRCMDNRYRNIWTYEHSRVKLDEPVYSDDAGSDYLNASFVNPLRHLGGHRVYIASQAPLPGTYLAFWKALWEQECRVILMLSREFEGGRLQCHSYWEYTSAHLQVHVQTEEPLYSADLGLASENTTTPVAIKRTLALTLLADPAPQTRTLAQFQYLGWPDHSVPASPEGLLAVSALAEEARTSMTDSPRPLVVHCSAGIGRTGAQITIDAVLAYLKMTRRYPDIPPDGPTQQQCHDAWHHPRDLVFEALCVMREQRMSLVQTAAQYAFTYQALVHALVS